MADTSIEWTDATWNPVAGCTVISPGCTNCYAMRMAARLEAMGMEKYRGLTRKSGRRAVWTGKVRLDRKALGIPAGWKKPRRIFVNSMSDLFHEGVSAKFVGEIWSAMRDTPHHTYQILTKRPDRMAALTAVLPVLDNVWLGTSVESADFLTRIDDLRRVKAAVRLFRSSRCLDRLPSAISRTFTGLSSAEKADLVPGRCRRNGLARLSVPAAQHRRPSSSNNGEASGRKPQAARFTTGFLMRCPVTRLYRSAARDHFHQHIVNDCGEAAIFRAKNPCAQKILRDYQP
jgi:protein gp37